MSTNENAEGNWTAALADFEAWMQLVDWETPEWIADAPASATEGR